MDVDEDAHDFEVLLDCLHAACHQGWVIEHVISDFLSPACQCRRLVFESVAPDLVDVCLGHPSYESELEVSDVVENRRQSGIGHVHLYQLSAQHV